MVERVSEWKHRNIPKGTYWRCVCAHGRRAAGSERDGFVAIVTVWLAQIDEPSR